MSNRRSFIRNSFLMAGAITLPQFNLKGQNDELPAIFSDDENYWKAVRAQFPLTSERIFLNNGTMGPSPFRVLNTLQDEMFLIESTGRYGGNEEDAIESLSKFIGSATDEISLTRNVTEGINIICWGLNLKKGDEVILTKHEHVGNAGPWLNRAKIDGIVIKTLDLGFTAEETIENFKKIISKKTKAISLPHIPCTIGQILPIKEICQITKELDIYSFIDGAHPPGMIVIDMKDLGCDFYASCCHKWMNGPKGTAFLYISAAKRNEVQAYYGGGGMDTGWDMHAENPQLKGYVDNGHRYYYGTQNAALFKGISAAIDFQNQIGRNHIEARVRKLATYLQDHLINLHPTIEMLTPTEAKSRGAQVSFKIKNRDVSELQKKCLDKLITTRYVPENNINCLRISTHIYNTYQEIDTFLETVDEFVKS